MFSVVLDACVLYPAYLRDTLLRLGAAGLYRPLWSDDIIDEVVRNLPGNVGDDSARRMVAAMRRALPDATVTGYDHLIEAMTNDPKDRHVLAAAVRADAAAVITFNLRDFPDEALNPLHVDAIHPDAFLLDLLDLAPGGTLDVLGKQVAGYQRPEMDLPGLAGRLRRAGCPGFADQLSLHLGGQDMGS